MIAARGIIIGVETEHAVAEAGRGASSSDSSETDTASATAAPRPVAGSHVAAVLAPRSPGEVERLLREESAVQAPRLNESCADQGLAALARALGRNPGDDA